MKLFTSFLVALSLAGASLRAADAPADGELVNFKDLDTAALKVESGAEASSVQEGGAPALKVTFPAGKGYPGVSIPGPWDLSSFSGVAVDLTNSGSGKVGVSVRVDNAGDWQKSPWNTEVIWLEPGASRTATVTFGQSYGKPGYALNPSAVSQIKIFLNTPAQDGEILVQSIKPVAK